MIYICCKKRAVNKRWNVCYDTQAFLFLWEWDIKVARYWSPGTINMKPSHLCICSSGGRLPLKSVIMTPSLCVLRPPHASLCRLLCMRVCISKQARLLFVCLLQQLTGPVILTGHRQFPWGLAYGQQLAKKKSSCWWASTKSPHCESPYSLPSLNISSLTVLFYYWYSFPLCPPLSSQYESPLSI